ncbi:hypothetical protein ABW03_11270 [Bacillus altitudinis]|nr:hypothetical protein ABW03_11270 [Bacillus altitudinis]
MSETIKPYFFIFRVKFKTSYNEGNSFHYLVETEKMNLDRKAQNRNIQNIQTEYCTRDLFHIFDK